MIVHLHPFLAADLEIGSVIATSRGWARVLRCRPEYAEVELLPWWSPARVWRTIAVRVGLGGWV